MLNSRHKHRLVAFGTAAVATLCVQQSAVGLPVGTAPRPAAVKPVRLDWRYTTVPESMRKLFGPICNVSDALWPELSKMKMRSVIAAQVEQETCISPTSARCGSARAELKTSREYGFGLGQTTIAYNKDGTERFNVWADLRRTDPVLKAKWTWENRYDVELQLRGLMVKDKMSWSSIRFDTVNDEEHMAFAAATYNSGSVLVDRRICMAHPDCEPRQWFSTATLKGVEAYSSKSEVVQSGYGQSFRTISREYPQMLMRVRRPKYVQALDK